MSKRASELVSEGAASKPKKTIGKMKVQGTKSMYSFHQHTMYLFAILCLLFMKTSWNSKTYQLLGCCMYLIQKILRH